MGDLFLLRSAEAARHRAVTELLRCNEATARYGLVLAPNRARELLQTQAEALKDYRRVEFMSGTIPRIVMAFCDSPYLWQENYAETLADLVATFYYFKNETLDRLTDDELLGWMRSRFDNQCQGSIELAATAGAGDFGACHSLRIRSGKRPQGDGGLSR